MKPPVVANRLGSLSQVNNSVIGVNGAIDGTVTYSSVKFDNGADTGTVRNNRVVFLETSGTLLPNTDQYTVEYWCQPTWACTDSVAQDGVQHLLWGLHTDTSDSTDWEHINIFNGSSYWYSKTPSGTELNPRLDTISGLTWTASEIFHIAWVVDKNGIGGGSDTLRVYKNGTSIFNYTGSRTTGASSTIKSFVLGSYDNFTAGASAGAKTVFDNVRLYDYAKTDFSDRFNERGGFNDHQIIL